MIMEAAMKEYKMTIIGDIMGEPSVFEQAKRPDGSFDFYPALSALKSYFDEADYGIGNLETVMAGEEAGYTEQLVSFNTPDSIADAVKAIGIDAVTTANNHLVDRGIEGLRRTCRVLDEKGLAHTGTYDTEPEDRTLYFQLGETKIALMSYTASCNAELNKKWNLEKIDDYANLLRPCIGAGTTRLPEDPSLSTTKAYIEQLLGREMGWEELVCLRKAMNLPVAYADDVLNTAPLAPLLASVKAAYDKARAKADIVLICPHSGGQFNTEPGKLSQYIFTALSEMGFDGIFAAHSHTTQRLDRLGKTISFNSLGNVTMSPMTNYTVHETMPEYGIAAHIYIAAKRISRTAFSIFKMVEHAGDPLHTVPVDELYVTLPEGTEKARLLLDVAAVYERISGQSFEKLQREWPLFE